MDKSSYFIVLSLVFIQAFFLQVYINDFLIALILSTVIGLVIVAGAFKLEKYLYLYKGSSTDTNNNVTKTF